MATFTSLEHQTHAASGPFYPAWFCRSGLDPGKTETAGFAHVSSADEVRTCESTKLKETLMLGMTTTEQSHTSLISHISGAARRDSRRVQNARSFREFRAEVETGPPSDVTTMAARFIDKTKVNLQQALEANLTPILTVVLRYSIAYKYKHHLINYRSCPTIASNIITDSCDSAERTLWASILVVVSARHTSCVQQ